MIFQFRFDQAYDALTLTKTINQTLPFSGRCRVKIIRVDVLNDSTVLASGQTLLRIQSDQLFNSTPFSGQLYVSNSINNYYGGNFSFECILPQNIVIRLLDLGGWYDGMIITADITPLTNDMIF